MDLTLEEEILVYVHKRHWTAIQGLRNVIDSYASHHDEAKVRNLDLVLVEMVRAGFLQKHPRPVHTKWTLTDQGGERVRQIMEKREQERLAELAKEEQESLAKDDCARVPWTMEPPTCDPSLAIPMPPLATPQVPGDLPEDDDDRHDPPPSPWNREEKKEVPFKDVFVEAMVDATINVLIHLNKKEWKRLVKSRKVVRKSLKMSPGEATSVALARAKNTMNELLRSKPSKLMPPSEGGAT
jgi:hypothetical protein